jgi:hypothetical protein
MLSTKHYWEESFVQEEAEGQAERESHAAACILFIFL